MFDLRSWVPYGEAQTWQTASRIDPCYIRRICILVFPTFLVKKEALGYHGTDFRSFTRAIKTRGTAIGETISPKGLNSIENRGGEFFYRDLRMVYGRGYVKTAGQRARIGFQTAPFFIKQKRKGTKYRGRPKGFPKTMTIFMAVWHTRGKMEILQGFRGLTHR